MDAEDQDFALAVSRAMSFPRLVAALWGHSMAFQSAAFGLGILLPGPEHFAAQSYQVALQLMPWWAWGVLFLATGTAMGLAVWKRPQRALLAAIPSAVAYSFLAVTLGRALFLIPTASAGAVVNYAGLAVMTIFAGWMVRYVERQWPR